MPVYEACFCSCFDLLRTLTKELKVKKFVLTLALGFSFYFRYQDYWTEEGVWGCGEPHNQLYCLEEGVETSGLVGPTTVGVGQGPSGSCSGD